MRIARPHRLSLLVLPVALAASGCGSGLDELNDAKVDTKWRGAPAVARPDDTNGGTGTPQAPAPQGPKPDKPRAAKAADAVVLGVQPLLAPDDGTTVTSRAFALSLAPIATVATDQATAFSIGVVLVPKIEEMMP